MSSHMRKGKLGEEDEIRKRRERKEITKDRGGGMKRSRFAPIALEKLKKLQKSIGNKLLWNFYISGAKYPLGRQLLIFLTSQKCCITCFLGLASWLTTIPFRDT